MRKTFFFLTATFILCTCFAHEYILLASKFRLQKGDTLEMHLFVADGFNIQLERPFQKAITKKFELLTRDSIIDLTASVTDKLPIVNRAVNFVGGGLIHMERDYARISLPTTKFLDYLKEDHIEGISAKVIKSKKVQKERYTRYIKSLVQSGPVSSDTLYKTITGQTFEIVLLQNPYTLHKGNTLKAKVYFQGKPLINKVITARSRTGSESSIVLNSRTDISGVCNFILVKKGDWFLHATHMIACSDKADSDWESFWTSYSFGVD